MSSCCLCVPLMHIFLSLGLPVIVSFCRSVFLPACLLVVVSSCCQVFPLSMCSYLRVTLSSVDNLHVRNTLYYLVARSRGILATGAICFDIRLAKTPHNIPATYDEFDWVPSRLLAIMRRSTNKNADFSGEKVPGYIQDWSKALPSPSPH